MPWIQVHCGALPSREIWVTGGLRITSPALSILDSAADLPSDELELVLGKARSRHLVRPSHFHRLRAWQPRRRGWKVLAAILDLEAAPDVTRSKAEILALSVVREAGLGEPRRNFRLHGFEVDLWLPELALVIEMDGFAYHSGRSSFVTDRRRDAVLRSHGIEVWRLSWEQVTKRRRQTITELRRWQLARHHL